MTVNDRPRRVNGRGLPPRRTLRASIATWRSNVFDLGLVVEERRRAVDVSVIELRAAVREHHRGVVHLARLIALLDEAAGKR